MKKHTSKYTDNLVTDAQLLAEICCERQAKRNKIDLPYKFWNQERWVREFKTQLRFANQLLKIYSFEAVMKALRSKYGANVYSLGAKFFDPIIKEEQKKIDLKSNVKDDFNIKSEKTNITETNNNQRPSFKKTWLEKLK